MKKRFSEDDKLFLIYGKVARLATYSPDDNFPHLVPLWYLYLNGHIYMATDKRSKKVRNIRKNPRVTVLIDAYEEETKFGESIWEIKGLMINGKAEIIESGPEYDKILKESLELKYPVYHEEEERWEEGEAVVIKIKPEKFCRWETEDFFEEKLEEIEKIKKEIGDIKKRLKKIER